MKFNSVLKGFSLCCVVLMSFYSASSFAFKVNVSVGDRLVPATVYEAPGNDLIVWLPSEYGFQGSYRRIAKKLGNFGIEVWYVDLFSANYLTPSAASINQIPVSQVGDLINQVIKYSSKRRIWLMSGERGAKLALGGLHDWQTKNPDNNIDVGGAILVNPNLTYGTPPVGKNPDYLPITAVTNKSLIVLQSRLSANYFHLPELVSQLKKGGALVKTYVIDNVREKFYFRKYTETIEERVRDREFPSLIVRGIKNNEHLIRSVKPHKEVPNRIPLPSVDTPLNITPVLNPQPFPNLFLNDTKGRETPINAAHGNKVRLVSIWPYWCASCRFQLKQHQALFKQAKDERFELLSVYFDDVNREINQVIKRYKIQFPLLESNTEIIKKLNLRTFPSTFIIDKKGKIRYSMYGVMRKRDMGRFLSLIDALKKEK